MIRFFLLLIPIFGLITALKAEEIIFPQLTLQGDFIEGGMVIGKTNPQNSIILDKLALQLSPEGTFVFGFHRDAPPSQTLKVVLPTGRIDQYEIHIKSRQYQIQHINGLPTNQVSPPEETLSRIRQNTAMVRSVRTEQYYATHFLDQWQWPLNGIITGIYGSQRYLNGKPRAPHYGIDIASPEDSPVFAPAGGKVILLEDLYFSGITLMIDHGMGIVSSFLHLKTSHLKVGDIITKGNEIARSGNTGRSTGAHLDWRVNWFNHARLDASLLVPPMTQ